MKNVVLAAALAVAGVMGSVNTASAVCTWGNWSFNAISMSGSFNANYAECQTGNTWAGVFKARTWMHGSCALGAGCRQVGARRVTVTTPIDQCTWGGLPMPGIGLQARANIVNVLTGTATNNVLWLNTANSTCGTTYGHTVAGNNWFRATSCRIAHSC